MIRWYDWIIAWYTANLIYGLAVIPWFGWLLALLALEAGWDVYCEYRLVRELNRK